MSEIINQAEALRQQAISLLMAERQDIDRKLAMLGADGTEPPLPKAKNCRACGEPGHTARTCQKSAKIGLAAPSAEA